MLDVDSTGGVYSFKLTFPVPPSPTSTSLKVCAPASAIFERCLVYVLVGWDS